MNQLNFNGRILPKDTPVFKASNRAFHYGDGLFETIRVFNGKIPFLTRHLNRLKHGMQLLQIEGSERFEVAFVQNEIFKIPLNGEANFRARLTVFRAGEGLYTPENNQANYLIELKALKEDNFKLNAKGLQLGLYTEMPLSYHPFSNLKTCNALPYILASKYKKDQNYDDCILLNAAGRLAECTSSNLFLIKGKTLWTPSLKEACLDGICRALILEIASSLNFTIREIPLSLDQLDIAEEVWLTNSIAGLRWVVQYQNNSYKNVWAKKFVQALQLLVKSNKNKEVI